MSIICKIHAVDIYKFYQLDKLLFKKNSYHIYIDYCIKMLYNNDDLATYATRERMCCFYGKM